MKKHIYSIIALVSVAGPVALSFDEKIHFWTHAPAVGLAILTVGLLYLLWDAYVTARGDWQFNPVYTGSFRIAGLPIGEILFFIAIPYACLFVYEVVVGYFGTTTWFEVDPVSLYAGAMVFVGAAWLFRNLGYTFIAMISVAVFLSTLALSNPALVGTSAFWIWTALSFVLFVLVDGLYTWLPTIFYNPKAMWGLRVGTIPLEDFFYNLSYLGLTLSFYLFFERILPV